MMTKTEVAEAMEAGDHYCKNCGYRKSLHGTPAHPTHGTRDACKGYVYGYFFNEAVVDEDWLREAAERKRMAAKARKTARETKARAS